MTQQPKHISRTMAKAKEVINKLAAKAPESVSVNEESNEKLNTELTLKYKAEIDSLDGIEMEAWNKFSVNKKNEVLMIRSKIDKNRYYSKSKPKIDMFFLVVLANNNSIQHIKKKLNEAYQWLVANPDRQKTNYRRFLLNFMKELPHGNGKSK